MKKISLLFLLISALFSTYAKAELHVLKGHHFENDYEFAMSDEYQDLHGTWGMSRYDLTYSDYDGVLEGTTGDEKQRLVVDWDLGTVDLTAYCGWADLTYSKSAPWRVKGAICLKPVDVTFKTAAEAHAWMKHEMVSRMVTEFPEPVRKDVQNFLSGLLRF